MSVLGAGFARASVARVERQEQAVVGEGREIRAARTGRALSAIVETLAVTLREAESEESTQSKRST